MRLLVGLIGIFVLVESSSLWAACKWDQVMSGFRPDPYNSVVVPPSITMMPHSNRRCTGQLFWGRG